MSNLIERNNLLKGEANQLLNKGLKELLKSYNYIITGSYKLDVMSWADLDLYVDVKDVKQEDIYRIVCEIFKLYQPTWTETKDTFNEDTGCPKGYFIGYETLVINNRLWNVDIWFTNANYIKEHVKYINVIKDNMDDEKRKIILTLKNVLCHQPSYGVDFFSTDIYQAVLDEGVGTIHAFKMWLKDK